MHPENPDETRVIIVSINLGYDILSDLYIGYYATNTLIYYSRSILQILIYFVFEITDSATLPSKPGWAFSGFSIPSTFFPIWWLEWKQLGRRVGDPIDF